MSNALQAFFVPHVEQNLDLYNKAVETLDAADGGGGNRRTVANAVADEYGDVSRFIDQVVNRIIKEASPVDTDGNVTGPVNPAKLFHLVNTLNKQFDPQKGVDAAKEMEAFVAGEVEKLKANKTVTISDDERTNLRTQWKTAYDNLVATKDMIVLSRSQFDNDGLSEQVDELLRKIEDAKLAKPRNSSGKTGPRLKPADGGKYEFYVGDSKVSNNLRKLAEIYGVNQADVKLGIAEQNLEDLSDENVKAWFNKAPSRFEFSFTDSKGVSRDVIALRVADKATDAGESGSDDDEDEDDES